MSGEAESLDLNLYDDDEEYQQPETRFEGYADYRRISLRVARAIDEAVDAYAQLQSRHREGAKVTPEFAAMARARILAAAMKLIPELEENRETVDDFDAILVRWREGEEEDEDGHIKRLNEAPLSQTCPGWLFQMVLDIRSAGWEQGYLRAGREREAGERDPVEEETDDMLQE
jgi:hypothetical protein